MFRKEPLNPNVPIATLKNKEGKVLFLMTRISPPTNYIGFAFDIGPHHGKPLYETQSHCLIQYVNDHLIEKYPDFSFFSLEEESND